MLFWLGFMVGFCVDVILCIAAEALSTYATRGKK